MNTAAKNDAAQLYYNHLSVWENGSSRIRMSLLLEEQGKCGSQIHWQSSNPHVITRGGRVIRPRWYEDDAVVTMRATVQNGDDSIVKDFSFTVCKDEKWTDGMPV